MSTTLLLFVIQEAIKLEPSIAAELKTLFSGATVTPEMIAARRAQIAGENFDAMVPNSGPAAN